MRFIGTLLCVLTVGVMTSVGYAQDDQLFNGNGINMSQLEPGRTAMFDFSKLANEPAEETEPLFKFPKLAIPKWQTPKWNLSGMFQSKKQSQPVQLSDQQAGNGSFELPKWNVFPAKDPNQPTFLQRMNNRNREFWGRTKENLSSWTADSDNLPTNRGFETWNRITRGFNSDSQQAQPPAQPPLRTSQQQDGETPIRY